MRDTLEVFGARLPGGPSDDISPEPVRSIREEVRQTCYYGFTEVFGA